MLKYIHAFLLLLVTYCCAAQVRITIVNTVPMPVPNKPLFLATDFNGWSPNDPNYAFKLDASGHYYLDIPHPPERFEYKVTNGNWALAEGDDIGGNIPNRVYNAATFADPHNIQVNIAGWENKLIYTFIVRSIPKSTPHDAALYITGNFNDWEPGNPLYKLQHHEDGTWRVSIFTSLNAIKYKFTRGNWESVEGRSSGKALPNREVKHNEGKGATNIEVNIDGWEDLAATFNFYSLYDLLLLLSAFQGLLLIIAIPTIQDYNRAGNRWLVITIAFVSCMIFLRVIGSYRPAAEAFTKILLIPDFAIFLYAPLFYIYLQKLLFNHTPRNKRQVYHFIPSILQVAVYLPFFLLSDRALQLDMMNQDPLLMGVFLGSGLLGLAWNIYYWFLFRATLRFYKAQFMTNFSYEQNLNYLNTVHVIQAVCLGMWLFMFIALGAGYMFNLHVWLVVERSVDMIWLVFSTITYFVGYYAIHQPEIFKVSPQKNFSMFDPAPLEKEVVELKIETEEPITLVAPAGESENESIQQLMEAVEGFMHKSKLFTNPRLSLNELAQKIQMPVHTLSKVLNDGFGKNFFDFVNGFRVEEFKKRVDNPRFKNHTLLSIAYDVGFNSKTAFNRSFKKITGQTPREYYSETMMKEE